MALPGVEFVLLGFDLLLTGMSAVDQLPGNLVHHSDPGRLVVHLRLQTLKPGHGDGDDYEGPILLDFKVNV